MLLLALLGGAFLLGAAPAAFAHDGLVGTTPAAGTSVPTPPATVELAFSGEPLPLGTLVLVTDANGAVLSEGDAEIRGTSVVQRLVADRPAGAYQVVWRSTSSDGHALTGTFGFTVAAGSTPSAQSPESAAPTPEPAAPSPAAVAEDLDLDPASAGSPVAGVWVAVGAIVLVGLGSLVVSRQRRRG
ncbi:hypothetical protein SAMN04515665_13319 [Blastococcus sp. DSM 46786]|uniref:copper resistance CopC family protein n=1 Tax=Blastococcus sp. DSM 46786 TaxID=1798227 RepID=UPI0008C39F34|nr:copper resistance CopC family protein [Blastococcus sp. DSM 46786]SEM13233.1 hypothetical protein SAMN04515665_13319 [Blastococcus sp. DSM 46786]